MERSPRAATREGSSEPLKSALKRHFGFDGFRSHQRSLVQAMLAGRDVLAVLPTGSGKSLCYQLPALVTPGLTLVVSPLVSLMDDQVAKLNSRGIAAAALHSSLPRSRSEEVRRRLGLGELKLLYVSPERLLTTRFLGLVGGSQIRRVAVDEAHCVSDWGHDFRPAYRRIEGFLRRVGRPPVAAFTATATPATRADVCSSLGLRDPHVLTVPADRPNLRWEVRSVSDPWVACRRASRAVRAARGASIVYVITRRHAVRLAVELRRRGTPAVPYHAGLSDTERREIQTRFLTGELPAVAATTAFGMGIDHPRVRLVCHLGCPGSLEEYVQAAGRAGRDGEESRCLLLPTDADEVLHGKLLRSSWPRRRALRAVWSVLEPGGELGEDRMARRLQGRVHGPELAGAVRVLGLYGAIRVARDGRDGTRVVTRRPDASWNRIDLEAVRRGRRRALDRLAAMRAYAASRRCRREVIADYFGEAPPDCAGCDRCGGHGAKGGGPVPEAGGIVGGLLRRVSRLRSGS